MKTTRWLGFPMVVAICAALPACGDDDGSGTESPDAAVEADDDLGTADDDGDDDTGAVDDDGDDDTADDDQGSDDDGEPSDDDGEPSDDDAEPDDAADDAGGADDDLAADDAGADDEPGDAGFVRDGGTSDGGEASPSDGGDGEEAPASDAGDDDVTAPGDAATVDAAKLEACQTYCTVYFTNCESSDANTYDDEADCNTTCAESDWEIGSGGPGTISCRSTHAALAAMSPNPHCYHAAEVPSMGACE